jgi:hypothetical protein
VLEEDTQPLATFKRGSVENPLFSTKIQRRATLISRHSRLLFSHPVIFGLRLSPLPLHRRTGGIGGIFLLTGVSRVLAGTSTTIKCDACVAFTSCLVPGWGLGVPRVNVKKTPLSDMPLFCQEFFLSLEFLNSAVLAEVLLSDR